MRTYLDLPGLKHLRVDFEPHISVEASHLKSNAELEQMDYQDLSNSLENPIRQLQRPPVRSVGGLQESNSNVKHIAEALTNGLHAVA